MKNTSKTATATLEKLRECATPGGLFKIERDGAMMPLWVERLEELTWPSGLHLEVWSIAHHYIQEGDVMRDPEVVFLRVLNLTGPPQWFPIEFRQDPYIRQELATLRRDLLPESYTPKAQRDCATFVTTWCKNLEHQHGAILNAEGQELTAENLQLFFGQLA